MAPYADDDYEHADHHRPRRRKHRSSHRESSHSYERERDRDSLRYEQPDLPELRRARVQYYDRDSDQHRRRHSRDLDEVERRMAYERSVRRKPSVRRIKVVREDDMDGRRRRSSRRADDESRSGEHVYRSRERSRDRSAEEPRRRYTVRHVPADKDLRRSKTRKLAEEVVVEEELAARPEVDARPHRASSIRESPRPYMATRPARRSTSTRVRETAPEEARSPPPTVSASPMKTRRHSTGILGLFRPIPAPTPVVERRVECVVCLQDSSYPLKAAKLSCGHGQCHECLRRQFSLSVKDPQHMPPRCCTDEHIPLKYVDRLFNDKFKMLWNQKYEEYTTKNRVYCPYRDCGQWIKPSNIKKDSTTGRMYGKCGRCRQKMCVKCNGKFHTKRNCPKDEETKRVIEMAKEKGWQRCYNCKTMVELKEGCYHMTCRCTAQFCMLCAAKWKTCTCPWFEHPDLEPAERLLNMQVPHVYHVPIDTYRRPPSPPTSQAQPLRRSNTTTYTSLPRRSNSLRQPVAPTNPIDHVTRFFQATLNMGNPTPPSSHERNRDVDVQVYGVGNAGGHHLNESYAIRPTHRHSVSASAASRPRPAAPSAVAAQRAWRFNIAPRRERERREAPPARDVAASIMAGLSKGGGRTGSNRVDTWRLHVRHDPDAVAVADRFPDEVWSEVDSDLGYES
ncbi:hypothetical protein EJ05DRAFT_508309 [Pseudovirgaria hyperparasitica]|uniref:RBR-type E3 ubiquitin transferase n=1 Tax=Pseudovirgaria hyperparasitica TaxID=470096 RepID=A0A6A6WEG1_9PEZI|nr:uncharacterized protein EJ05DRAFT_508309 [Pseudovirgaria hyperparasitica]KAF2761103.1 hypothetical protein EJ05DRAFT_508309 [Pseudovirgaria hyperparasitica]